MRSQYGLIVVWVVVFASIFIGAFFLKFGSWPTSDDPGDWADFATYLSGTVGVTAVVGTLFAVVRTLGQQQELLKSQDEMLEKQTEQLSVAKKQLEGEEQRRSIEFAYSNATAIFPHLFDSMKKHLDTKVFPYENEQLLAKKLECEYGIVSPVSRDLFNTPEVLIKVLGGEHFSVMSSYSKRIYKRVEAVYDFVIDHLEIDEDLIDYFNVYLDSEDVDDEEFIFYLECFNAFLVGVGDEEGASKGRRFFTLPKDYSTSRSELKGWQDIGELVRKTSTV